MKIFHLIFLADIYIHNIINFYNRYYEELSECGHLGKLTRVFLIMALTSFIVFTIIGCYEFCYYSIKISKNY